MTKRRNHIPPNNDDAFEREAAEGFGMLGSEEEIAALKAETDRAFAEQFNQPKKNDKAPWLWMAAAFVIVGLGLTLFSVLSPDRKMDMAQAPTTAPIVVPSDAQLPAETLENKPNEGAKEKTTRTKDGTFGISTRNEKIQSNASSEANKQELDMEESAPAAVAEPQLVATEVKAPEVYTSSSSNLAAVSTSTVAPVELKLAADKAVVVKAEKEALSKKAAESKALKSKQNPPAAAKEENADVIIGAIIYKPGVKQLEADAKKLLKNFHLPKEILVELYLDAEAQVMSATISSKETIDPADKLAAQNELKKLSNFTVTPLPDEKLPYRYSFSLKR